MSHDSIVNLSSTTQAKNKPTDSSIKKHFTDTLELDLLQSGLSSLMMSSIQVSKLKAEAKKTKKEFNLKLTENQDRLAEVIGMKNWKEVTLAYTNYLVKETAFNEGVIVVLRTENLSKLYQGEEHFALDHELYKFMLSDIYNDKFGNVHWWDKADVKFINLCGGKGLLDFKKLNFDCCPPQGVLLVIFVENSYSFF
jgi:hypothetical protein